MNFIFICYTFPENIFNFIPPKDNRFYSIADNTFRDEYGFSEEVANALRHLSNEDRDLICYYYGAGYSYKEISGLMGISPEALRKRMGRVKIKLADILSREVM